MKATLDKIADGVLTRLGLKMEFDIDLGESFLSPITPTLYLAVMRASNFSPTSE